MNVLEDLLTLQYVAQYATPDMPIALLDKETSMMVGQPPNSDGYLCDSEIGVVIHSTVDDLRQQAAFIFAHEMGHIDQINLGADVVRFGAKIVGRGETYARYLEEDADKRALELTKEVFDEDENE